MPAPEELSWEVNGLRLAGLSWGKPELPPVLALHGWLDNAASFNVLAPLLARDHHVVAVDLSGHGRSAWRSPDATYQIWDDLPQLRGVADALGWAQFSLLGHSRGAIMSCLLASAQPERVRRLVLLDGLAPTPVEESDFPQQLRRFLDDRQRWSGRRNRMYPDVETALASREAQHLPANAARALVERNLKPCEGGYTWTTDLRLRGASAVKMSRGHIQAVLAGLSMPTLLLLADGGFGEPPELANLARAHIPQLELASASGGHHFHLEPGAAIVADRIRHFLQE